MFVTITIYFEGYSIFLVAIFQKVAYLWATIVTKLFSSTAKTVNTYYAKMKQMHTYGIKSNIRKKNLEHAERDMYVLRLVWMCPTVKGVRINILG